MKETLSVAIIQSDLVWETPLENRRIFYKKIGKLKHSIDLVVLPEMFSTGFTMNPEAIAETMDGETIVWMKNIALEKNIALSGSMVIKEGQKYYNRLLFVKPSGTIEYYDKKHTFTLAGEDKVYGAGNTQKTVSFQGWEIALQVCYDLRFPVWSRNTPPYYDALLYVANWPAPRITAWDTLLKARAIENMCYSLGANRVGTDANGHRYSGHSAVYDALGNTLAFSDQSTILYANLQKSHLHKNRNHFRFLEDGDAFALNV